MAKGGMIRPWYGGWPPILTAKGKEMVGKDDKWRKSALILILLAMFTLGLLVLWNPLCQAWVCLSQEIKYGLGVTLIATAITSGAVNWYFSQELARDVFRASIGYLLPEQLVPELRWIYQHQLLCTRSHTTFALVDTENGKIMVTVDSSRTIENVSGESAELDLQMKVEERSAEEVKFPILNFSYEIRGTGKREEIKDCQHKNACLPRANVGKGAEIWVHERYRVVREKTDSEYLSFTIPTSAPVFVISKPDNLEVYLTLGGRKQLTDMGGRNFMLDGVALPYQGVLVRWRPSPSSPILP